MLDRSRMGNFLNTEKSRRTMPGASRIPRPAFPGRFAPAGASANAAVLNHLFMVRISDPALGSPTISGRTPALDGELLTLPSPPGALPNDDGTASVKPLLSVT